MKDAATSLMKQKDTMGGGFGTENTGGFSLGTSSGDKKDASGGGFSMSQAAGSSLRASERKAGQAKHAGLTRAARATCEQVLDPRTRLLLFKLINSGTLEASNGCVSTG